jgi:predicted RNase H-like HicB family nuclease
MIAIDFDVIVFKEDNACIAYCPQLDASSCGDTIEGAKKMIKTAVKLFIEESEKMGTLEEILFEANYNWEIYYNYQI